MSTIAVIPARGGSKGVKNKNIINLMGKPLIHYILETCENTKEIDKVVVSTDSNAIKSTVLEKYPKTIIIDRPEELSGDDATSEVVLLHAIECLSASIKNTDRIVFLQATSPLTTSNDLSKLIGLLDKYDSATFYVDDCSNFFDIDEMRTARVPRQKKTPRKKEAGNAWVFYKEEFLKRKTRLHRNVGLLKILHPCDLEIDDYVDLMIVESVIKSSYNYD